jgi:serine/threonine-protein kinase
MTRERWHQVTDLFHAALEQDSVLRPAFLDTACAHDQTLRREVEAMLAAHANAGAFGDEPVSMSTANLPTLQRGTTVGPYQIQEAIGAGGMGVVYRAHDARVRRDVAIKMLPAEYASDPERLQRFEQEARAVGALSHPNLLTLYDVGISGKQPYLVTELLDGETLRVQIGRGPMAWRRACEVAADVAHGLAAAHVKGIVHRDLKPENVMMTRDGRVKILDFGIAKLRPSTTGGTTLSPDTQPDTVLGTVGYMAPEQIRGLSVDHRADLFVLGAILFELLTGQRAFRGASRVETLNAILHHDPLDDSVKTQVAAAVEPILRRCLAKDPDSRFQSARDLAFALASLGRAGGTANSSVRDRWARWGRYAAAGVVLLGVVWAVATFTRGSVQPTAPPSPQISRFLVPPLAGTTIAQLGFALSPDGKALVYRGISDGKVRLYFRRLDQFEAVPLAGTDSSGSPFFSPDGEWIGFATGGRLKKIRVSGASAAVDVCDVKELLGASWASDNTILLSTIQHGLQRVSADGGTAQPLLALDKTRGEIDHHNPVLLPGGSAVLFTAHEGEEVFRVAVQSLASGERKVLIADGFDAQYLSTGHLVYAAARTIFAVPFDLANLEITGTPVKMIDNIATVPDSGRGNFAVSANGSLAFLPEPSRTGRTLSWIDRSGVETPLPVSPRLFSYPRLSPDGQRLAVSVRDQEREDVWIYRFDNRTLLPSAAEGSNYAPLWTPDGRALIFTSTRNRTQRLVVQPLDTDAPAESLVESENRLIAGAWTPGGDALIYVDSPPTEYSEIKLVRRKGDRRPEPLVRIGSDGTADWPALSPDGRWLAFVSFETGAAEIYVQPFPGPGPRRQITAEGGRHPIWRRDGRELFYRVNTLSRLSLPDAIAALPFDPVAGAPAGQPVTLFKVAAVNNSTGAPGYDVTPDGKKFVVVKTSVEETMPRNIHVVLNWSHELAERVPRAGQ